MKHFKEHLIRNVLWFIFLGLMMVSVFGWGKITPVIGILLILVIIVNLLEVKIIKYFTEQEKIKKQEEKDKEERLFQEERLKAKKAKQIASVSNKRIKDSISDKDINF